MRTPRQPSIATSAGARTTPPARRPAPLKPRGRVLSFFDDRLGRPRATREIQRFTSVPVLNLRSAAPRSPHISRHFLAPGSGSGAGRATVEPSGACLELCWCLLIPRFRFPAATGRWPTRQILRSSTQHLLSEVLVAVCHLGHPQTAPRARASRCASAGRAAATSERISTGSLPASRPAAAKAGTARLPGSRQRSVLGMPARKPIHCPRGHPGPQLPGQHALVTPATRSAKASKYPHG